jgi:hypothetical protein
VGTLTSLWSPGITLLEIAVRTTAIYFFVLIGFRLTGKR